MGIGDTIILVLLVNAVALIITGSVWYQIEVYKRDRREVSEGEA